MTGVRAVECKHCGASQPARARFCNECGARLVASDDERRPLAVLFCDIVGSTNYLRKLGPEDWLSILRNFHETISGVVLRFGGYVAQDLGDGALIYFGFPQAHDDDARRAVESALEIVAAMSTLNEQLLYRGWPELRIRIGISTGRALVGSVRSGSEALARGEIPHLAARLQNMADPNTIVVDAATYRLVEGFFTFRELVGKAPRDYPDEALYVVEARTNARTRLDASRNRRGLSPFVGRVPELRTLSQCWDEVLDGNRRAVLVKGEAGMGKTRLIHAFSNMLDGADHVFECRASPYHQNRALHPIVDMLERTLGLRSDEPNERRLDKLRRWLQGSSALDLSALPALAPMFSVSLPPDPSAPMLAPQKQRQLVFESVLGWLDFLGRRGCTLLIVEDLHWADPSTLELLTNLLSGKSGSRLLVLLTARPEFRSPWDSACLGLELERLSDSETETIVTSMVPNQATSRKFVDFVYRKAEGVPLFTEELTRMLVETGVLGDDEAPSSASAPPSSRKIPSTLSGLLMARLDGLGRAKKTAQLAAAIGRDFHLEILADICSTGSDELATDIGELMESGIVHPSVGQDFYAFKHALIRDAAYDLMSSHARESAHARIAGAVERRFPDVLTNQPDLLAYHYAAAKQTSKAIGFGQRAAEQALQRSAYAEAIAHASNVSEWADAVNGSESAEAKLGANGVLSQAMSFTKGWADPQVKAIADRSAILLRELDVRSPHRIPTLWSLFAFHHTASNRRDARKVAEELVAVAESSGDAGFRAAAATILGITLHPEGNIAAARLTLENAIKLYDPELHKNQGAEIGLDSLVLAKALLAHLCWFAGETTTAFELVRDALGWARSVGHMPSIAIGLLYSCQVYQFAGNRPVAAEMTGEILSMAKRYGLPAYEGYAAIVHAWATRNEELAEGVVAGLKSMGCNLCLSYYASLVAENMVERGAIDAAIDRIDECLSLCDRNEEHYYEPELHRRRAMYQLRSGASEESVRASLERAAELANRQNMPRIEMLAVRELSSRFESSTSKERLADLLALHPALRGDESTKSEDLNEQAKH